MRRWGLSSRKRMIWSQGQKYDGGESCQVSWSHWYQQFCQEEKILKYMLSLLEVADKDKAKEEKKATENSWVGGRKGQTRGEEITERKSHSHTHITKVMGKLKAHLDPCNLLSLLSYYIITSHLMWWFLLWKLEWIWSKQEQFKSQLPSLVSDVEHCQQNKAIQPSWRYQDCRLLPLTGWT